MQRVSFRVWAVSVSLALLLCACGFSKARIPTGWNNEQTTPTTAKTFKWKGEQTVNVRMEGEASVTVLLKKIRAMRWKDPQTGAEKQAVRLSDVVLAAFQGRVTPSSHDNIKCNFIATDGYDVFRKKFHNTAELPPLKLLDKGFLVEYFEPGGSGNLVVQWDPSLKFSRALNVRLMNGGILELIRSDAADQAPTK